MTGNVGLPKSFPHPTPRSQRWMRLPGNRGRGKLAQLPDLSAAGCGNLGKGGKGRAISPQFPTTYPMPGSQGRRECRHNSFEPCPCLSSFSLGLAQEGVAGREMGGALTSFPSGGHKAVLLLLCCQDLESWGQNSRKVSNLF